MKIPICLSNTEYNILSLIIKEHYPFTTFENCLVNNKLSIMYICIMTRCTLNFYNVITKIKYVFIFNMK